MAVSCPAKAGQRGWADWSRRLRSTRAPLSASAPPRRRADDPLSAERLRGARADHLDGLSKHQARPCFQSLLKPGGRRDEPGNDRRAWFKIRAHVQAPGWSAASRANFVEGID